MLERVNYPEDIKKLKIKELKALADDIRTFLIESVTQTGGHLSPNLGVVELTIALHAVFDCPKDEIIWDVGHQSYVHKILTGRKACFNTLRMKDGLSGYPCPEESPYDVIHAGHSSTSLSIASGIARAKLLTQDPTATIAVIGDGAFTAGIAYEAINTISHDNLPVIILLNDNGMSISKNVGGISKYLKKLQISHTYLALKRKVETLKGIPWIGHWLIKNLYRAKEFIKSVLIRKNFFEDLGISYYGPIDGHDIKKLKETFTEIRGISKPIIIHVMTVKGRGYKPSEENPGQYHGISGVAVNGDSSIPLVKEMPSYSAVFGKTLTDMAEKDNSIFAITAAMKSGTGLKPFAERFPERFADVGIAEQHAVDHALGLSLKGFKPVVAIYSTFLQRAFDQLVNDIGIANAKVLFCLDRAGLVPGDGETHQGIFDLAYLRLIPHFTVMMPACKAELEMMLQHTLKNLNGPVCIRYPKDEALDFPEYNPYDYPLVAGEGVVLNDSPDILVVSTGTLLKDVLSIKKQLTDKNIGIVNLRFAKPISYNMISILSKGNTPVLVLEEGIFSGGIAEALTAEILKINPNKKIESIHLPDGFPPVGTREELLDIYCLTTEKIATKINNMIR